MGTTTFSGPVKSEAGFGDTMTAGTGITTGTGTVYKSSVVKQGDLIYTRIFIDITGLDSSAAADIIGKTTTANCHVGQVTAALNGTIVGGRVTCLTVPTTGDPDIDLWYADEATGTEDAAISGLTNQVQLTNGGDHTIGNNVGFITAVVPAANKYLYLVAGAADSGTYGAGRLLIEMWGY